MRSAESSRVVVTLCFIFIIALGLGPRAAPARAEADRASQVELEALKSDLEKIKTSLESVKQELGLIRRFLTQRLFQPNMVTISLSGRPMLGNKEAPITIIEFSDYQCPYCSQFVQTTLPILKAEYIDTGQVRYVFRNFPLEQIHPHARGAAEAAHCAGDQGKYWEMHDVLFHNQKALQVEQLKTYAQSLGLDAATFETCIQQGAYAAEVQKDYEDGIAAGLKGTPAFFVGKTRPEDTIQAVAVKGAQPIAVFQLVINQLLEGK